MWHPVCSGFACKCPPSSGPQHVVPSEFRNHCVSVAAPHRRTAVWTTVAPVCTAQLRFSAGFQFHWFAGWADRVGRWGRSCWPPTVAVTCWWRSAGDIRRWSYAAGDWYCLAARFKRALERRPAWSPDVVLDRWPVRTLLGGENG